MNISNVISKKPHWFDNYQENLIENIKIEKKTEKKAHKQERRALRILNKLPEDIYELLIKIPKKTLIKFIKCGTPSRYYQKVYNHTLFNSYKVDNALYKVLVDRYEGHNNLESYICAWEITKLIAASFKEIMIEGENLYNTDFKKYKEYDLHFKKYEKYTTLLVKSVLYLHNKYTN